MTAALRRCMLTFAVFAAISFSARAEESSKEQLRTPSPAAAKPSTSDIEKVASHEEKFLGKRKDHSGLDSPNKGMEDFDCDCEKDDDKWEPEGHNETKWEHKGRNETKWGLEGDGKREQKDLNETKWERKGHNETKWEHEARNESMWQHNGDGSLKRKGHNETKWEHKDGNKTKWEHKDRNETKWEHKGRNGTKWHEEGDDKWERENHNETKRERVGTGNGKRMCNCSQQRAKLGIHKANGTNVSASDASSVSLSVIVSIAGALVLSAA